MTANGAGYKILIVEDEVLLSNVYHMVLTSQGYEVEIANNGLEGLEKLPQFQPDLVLLDLLMPKMDGKTFLRSLKAADRGKAKIIVYSNLYDGETAAEVRTLGADDMVLKSSLSPQQLVKLVNDTLS